MNAEEAWNLACGNLKGADLWWVKIKELYQCPSRHYHNLAFLDRKFQILHEIGAASDLNAVVIAIFFQYFEYDAQNRSSTMNIAHFQEFASECELPEELKGKVSALLAGDEEQNRHESDVQLLQDLDMSFLGFNADAYSDFIKLERKEYEFMSDHAYETMRRKVLQTFLLIPNIFLTAAFQNRFEAQARANIEAEVQSLGN
ncbi:uncharacterized protein LOC135938775 [Cloeon dipterum]|uniref:uncharacterized protein LOC135938775 n=1 Tax=Cloeon dipterum TaxID=197152 RepID=UPI0032202DE0